METDHQQHIPVLLTEVLQALSPQEGETYLDVTAGFGGHAAAVLERTLQYQGSVLVDRDERAIEALRKRFVNQPELKVMHDDFHSAAVDLVEQHKSFDMILADLGVSSVHLDNASRGFSLREDGPLDMRMDTSKPLTAADIVNTYSEDEITKLLQVYGEEPKARTIARKIIESRPLSTTSQLAQLVTGVWPGYSKVHPATRTFQALRIAVNDELGLLERTLPLLVQLLNPGGRLAVISFHSLEDRIVKRFIADNAGDRFDTDLRLLTKGPQTASTDELVLNPRARSAKLRAVVKIKKKG